MARKSKQAGAAGAGSRGARLLDGFTLGYCLGRHEAKGELHAARGSIESEV